MCLGGPGPLALLPVVFHHEPECAGLFWSKATKPLTSLVVCCETSKSSV